ncbi:hypothetical protein BMETH_1493583690563, partial [methanotrophic bacterial endosymbiont of Bathymodiolus sp.]
KGNYIKQLGLLRDIACFYKKIEYNKVAQPRITGIE